MKKILWIGLSNKINTEPLDENTNTGRIIRMIEEKLYDYTFYKTNLVNFAPINDKGKLRYPNKMEMELGYINLQQQINQINPDLCILLGNKVNEFLHSKIKNYITIKHPSYIYVYKRKDIDKYVDDVYNLIEEYFNNLNLEVE